ncbi:MAG TPA: thioredoxin domain-containing protein, partial [Lacipirellulaceae bacterium]|nr:thioredoxin domain-containing protein [Lacipirellulaceae bacterium]
SVDARWLVPHFEKMLYDNALLAATYVEAWQATGREDYARTARATLDYILRDMTDPAGGFYAAEDADSEGEEGKFYVWTPDEVDAVLGDEVGAIFGRVYDVTDAGNFEGRNILNLPKTFAQSAAILGMAEPELRSLMASSAQKLFAARQQRVPPGKDDKVIVAWNALAIDALARAGAALGEPRYIAAAAKAAAFLRSALVRPDGRLLHVWRRGTAKFDAYLDDYAALAGALVSLYEATFDPAHLDEALRLTDLMLKHFVDAARGGFYYTAGDHEQLITRVKEVADSSTPAANGLAAHTLVRLALLTGDDRYRDAAARALEAGVVYMQQAPAAMGQTLLAVDLLLGPTHELVLAGDRATPAWQATLADLHRRYLPHKVLAAAGPEAPPQLGALLAGKDPAAAEPTLYVCEGFACQEPAIGPAAIEARLAALAQ